MTVIRSIHADHGARFETVGGRLTTMDYGRPDRAGVAVRNGVGLTEPAYGIVLVEGSDRVEYVDNAVSNRVPSEDGQGCYALKLDPQGGIETDTYVYSTAERVLCFTPPGRARPLAEEWSEKTFIQDVEVRAATDEFGVFGVHGPQATEKVASVLNGAAAPDEPLTFVRGRLDDRGVTVVRTDAPTGEEGFEVVCSSADAERVFDVLLNHGLNAAPFGYRTWQALTLEAGTPLFDPDLTGRIPNSVGVRNGLDFEKGCYVGQEVVSRIENRGRPNERLVGLALDPESESSPVPGRGGAVLDGDRSVGEVTRGAKSPTLDETIAFAAVDPGLDARDLLVRVDGETVPAERRELPFVEGSQRSARIPTYPD